MSNKENNDQSSSRKRNWKKYTLEFLSIFVAVISAFALNNWNDNIRDRKAESKILAEILHGLEADKVDVDINIAGHKQGIQACNYWNNIFNDQETNLDTLQHYYLTLTRDFTSIQNTSGYETLKSKGFELIKNDSLRTHIISLYEFNYQTLRKLEEEYFELQFQENYFYEINRKISPHFKFDTSGNIVGLEVPLNLSDSDRRVLLSYLWKIRLNRVFVLTFYDQVKDKIVLLKKEIENELEN